MASVLILGSGFGGIVTARELRARLPKEHRITLVDRNATFHFGAEKTWVALGMRPAESIVRNLKALQRDGIDVVKAEITKIDAARRTAHTSAGQFSADYLVIALGSDIDMGVVPGLKEAAYSFYSLDEAVRFKAAFEKFAGGNLVLLIPRAPFKCPPAPYEGAFLFHDELRKRGLLEKTKLSVYTVEGAPMATAGPEIGKFVVSELQKRGIAYHPLHRTVSVDPAAKVVRFEGTAEAPFDMLVAVPPHVPPPVIKASGLAGPSGWIPAEPKRLRVEAHENVYAIGDCSVVPLPGRFKPDAPLVLPKAGVFADAEANVVARDIADRIKGTDEATNFEGKGFCYIEMGDMHATKGEGAFFQMPNPVMKARVPDMMQFVEKKEWIRDWVQRNLK